MSSGPSRAAVGSHASGGTNDSSHLAADTLPSIEQINRALAESGERDRLKGSLKAKLWECGWHERLKEDCLAELRQRGIDRVGPHELANMLGARAKASIPESVKGQMLEEIESFLDKVVVQQTHHG